MAFEYKLPDVGEGVAEGEIVAWHVEPGDQVTEDEVLAEVETDKAVVDLPSPVDGTIRTLHAEEGEVVAVGSVVVTIDVDGEDPESVDGEGSESEAGEGSGAQSDGAESEGSQPDTGGKSVVEPAGGDQSDGETPVASGRVFAPPNVRRLARELGVDISAVEGSGPSGRITESDVRGAAERGDEQQAEEKQTDEKPARKSAVTRRGESGGKSAESGKSESASEPATGSAGGLEAANRDRTLAVPSTRQLATEHDVDIDDVPTENTRDGEPFVEPEDVMAYVEAMAAGESTDDGTAATATSGSDAGAEPVRREPYRGIRRTIGNQMSASASTIPHATHHDTAVVSSLVEARAKLKERASDRGINLTYMPFILKAVVAALKEYPMLNTELDEENEEILYKEYYNIGIAVATEAGLMVPVVENVDQKGILQLATEVNELAEKARERRVSREEMQGGTFTITNFGAIGGEYATPIINKPETAILGLGAIEERPVVDSGEGASEVVPKHTLPLSLSIDHRVIDGAEGAQFTNTVIEYLEQPTLLLLE